MSRVQILPGAPPRTPYGGQLCQSIDIRRLTIQSVPPPPPPHLGQVPPVAQRRRKSRSAWVELIETLGITLILFLAARWSLQPFTVQGQSMEPTLHNGEYILVDKLTYRFRSPERGDVVVFVFPKTAVLTTSSG